MSVSRDIARLIREIGQHLDSNKGLDGAVKAVLSEKGLEKEIRFEIFYTDVMHMFVLAEEEVKGAVISEEARKVYLQRVTQHRRAFFSAIRAHDPKQVPNLLKTTEIAGDFVMISETIETAQIESIEVDDPKQMMNSAMDIAKSIRKLNIDKISEHALLLQFSSIVEILSHYELFGEQDLKHKCKETMQTLTQHWEEIVKKDESLAVRIREWLTSKLKMGVAVAQLTATGMTIAGYLTSDE